MMTETKNKKELHLWNFIELSDFVTLGGLITALLSIQQAVSGNLVIAFILLAVCIPFDHLDGKVARWTGKTNRIFGEVIDSLSDTVSYLVAPAVVVYLAGFNHPAEMVLLACFVSVGILRLARFSCIKEFKHLTVGMPVTYNGLLVPLFFAAQQLFGFDQQIVFFIGMLCSTLAMGSTLGLPEL